MIILLKNTLIPSLSDGVMNTKAMLLNIKELFVDCARIYWLFTQTEMSDVTHYTHEWNCIERTQDRGGSSRAIVMLMSKVTRVIFR